MIMSQNVPRLHRPILVLGSTNGKNSGEERVLTAESVPAERGLGYTGLGRLWSMERCLGESGIFLYT